MILKEFDKLIKKELLPKCFEIMDSKGIAYSGQIDKLGNFKRLAKMTNTPIELIWFVYFVKHFDALNSYIKKEYTDSEPIEGRIVDLINYLFLLYGIIKEKK